MKGERLMQKILSKIKENKLIVITALIIIVAITITIALLTSKKSKETSEESELSKYENTYIGDNTSVNNIVSLLPYADKKEKIELTTSEKPYTLTIKYNMSSSKELLEYNSYKIFKLINNVDKIIYELEDKEIEVLRTDIDEEKLNIYSIIENYLTSLEKQNDEKEYKTFISAKYFELDNNKDDIIVYLWAQIESYYKEENYVIASEGSSMPYKITLKDNEVIEYVIPEDGNKYQESIEKNFPQKVINQFDDIYVKANKDLHTNPDPNTVYASGEENILEVNVKNMVTTYYGINEGQINYANPYTLYIEDSKEKLTKIVEGAEYDTYLYGITANVKLNGEYMSLEKALKEKLISIEKLIEYSKTLALSSSVYKDGGSTEIKCKEYTIIKMNRIDGDKNLYICKQETTIQEIENLEFDVSEKEKNEIEQYINKVENNGFAYQEYSNVDEIDLRAVLYDGAGIGKQPTSEEREYIMNTEYNGKDVGGDMQKFTKADIENMYNKKTRSKIEENKEGINLNYCEKYKFYYNIHGDTNYLKINIVEAKKKNDGTYYIKYMGAIDTDQFKMVLNKIKNEYVFISNNKI